MINNSFDFFERYRVERIVEFRGYICAKSLIFKFILHFIVKYNNTY
jgi:hypothetical protein